MQRSYAIRFELQGSASEALTKFTKDLNIVLPSETVGGNISSNFKNFHQVTLSLPMLRRKVTFSVSSDIESIRKSCALYALACSLGTFVLVHSLDENQRALTIQIVGDNRKDLELLRATLNRFEKVPQRAENQPAST